MTRILVTGAAGFTGRYVAEVLSRQGHELHGLVHDHASGPVAGFAALHEANLCDYEAIRRVFDEVSPDHIIHLAAISFVAHSDLEEMYRVNIFGTRQMLQAAGEMARNPTSILLASSANVYGNARGGVLDETAPISPANDYGVTKAAMEYVASIYRPALPIITVRPFNYSGPGQSSQFIIPKIVEHLRQRAEIIELGNLDVERDFSDVRTVADAYARLIFSPAAIGQTFNVCSGQPIALRQILNLAMDLSGHRLEVQVKQALVRTNEVRSLLGSRLRLERTIGPLQHIAIKETLRWMLNA